MANRSCTKSRANQSRRGSRAERGVEAAGVGVGPGGRSSEERDEESGERGAGRGPRHPRRARTHAHARTKLAMGLAHRTQTHMSSRVGAGECFLSAGRHACWAWATHESQCSERSGMGPNHIHFTTNLSAGCHPIHHAAVAHREEGRPPTSHHSGCTSGSNVHPITHHITSRTPRSGDRANGPHSFPWHRRWLIGRASESGVPPSQTLTRCLVAWSPRCKAAR